MQIDYIKLAPYAWRAFQERARIGLLAADLEALWKAAQPLLAELQKRWPSMDALARTVIANVAPEFKDRVLGGRAAFDPGLEWGQGELKALGLYDGAIDGKMGQKTADAIRIFQTQAGFQGKHVDGLWGPDTAGAMMARARVK